MSFKETDFPGLIGYLKTIIKNEKDPILFKELVTKLVDIYDQVPVYPGIVNMCMGSVAKTAKPQDVQTGQQIFVQNFDDCYSGIVKSKDDNGVILKSVKSFATEDELELEFKEMDKVTVINSEVLNELWPSLVFDKEKK